MANYLYRENSDCERYTYLFCANAVTVFCKRYGGRRAQEIVKSLLGDIREVLKKEGEEASVLKDE